VYRALLVCNSTFPADPAGLHRLRGPQRDGLVLWNALVDRETGRFSQENAQVIFEGSRDDVAGAVESFFTAAGPDDVLLFYYTGHGRRHSGELVLCCRDTVTSRPMSTGLGCDALNKVIRTSSARAVVVVLDCCFGGAFKGEDSIEDDLAGTGRFVIAAASAAEEANDADTDGHASPFTAALAYGLTGGAPDADQDGLVCLEDLFAYLTTALPVTCPRPRRNFDGTGSIPIAIRPPSQFSVARDGVDGMASLVTGLNQFDRLIEQLAAPTLKLSARDMLITLGEPAINGMIDILLELTPSTSLEWLAQPRMTVKQGRLIPRIHEIMVKMMPESGQQLFMRLQAELYASNTSLSSRLIQLISKGLVVSGLPEFYRKVIEEDMAPGLFMQILASLDDHCEYPLAWLDLMGRTIEDCSFGSARRFDGLDFKSSCFRNVQLHGIDFSGNNFGSVNFFNCNLWQTRFDGSSLRDSVLIGDRAGFLLSGVSFVNCDLRGCIFDRVYADSVFRDNDKKSLEPNERISFAGARLGGASFRDSDLRQADFTGCIEFEQVQDWTGTRLHRAKGLSIHQFDLARQRGGRA
jgi:caspase domain-containing protein/pentapeptide repeat protein